MQICMIPDAIDPILRDRAYMVVDSNSLPYNKCDDSLRRGNMRRSPESEFHKGLTLTAGEKSGLLSPPSTHNFFLVYEELLKKIHIVEGITNNNHIPNWLVTGPEVRRE
jgi:hypothetical protein